MRRALIIGNASGDKPASGRRPGTATKPPNIGLYVCSEAGKPNGPRGHGGSIVGRHDRGSQRHASISTYDRPDGK